jgi:hypothetical protein
MCGIFHIYKTSIGMASMQGRLGFHFSAENFERLPDILNSWGIDLFYSGNWNIIWGAIVLSLLWGGIDKIKKNREANLLFLTIGLFFGAYIAFFIFTPTHINYHNTLSRITLHFFPVTTWLLTLLTFPHQDKA